MFGVIALGIIVAAAVLVIRISSNGLVSDGLKEVLPTYTQGELLENYQERVANFRQMVLNPDLRAEQVLEELEAELLEMRVPAHMRDKHLQAVLAVGQMQGKLETMNDTQARDVLRSLLEKLKES